MIEARPRTVRVSDHLWKAASKAAAENGTNLSAVVRRALMLYLGSPDAMVRYGVRMHDVTICDLIELSPAWESVDMAECQFLMRGCTVEVIEGRVRITPCPGRANPDVPITKSLAVVDCDFIGQPSPEPTPRSEWLDA